jgi:hypothetical protein
VSRRWGFKVLFLFLLVFLSQTRCTGIPFVPGSPTPGGALIFDAPVSFTVRSGALLPGTSIGYGGRTATGAAKVMIGNLVAVKQVADSLDWEGSPVPNLKLKLSTRILSFDDQAVTFVGAAHIEVLSAMVVPVGQINQAPLEFSAPVTYTVAKNAFIPGSNITFVGSSSEGAKFAGIEGYPYRQNFDSLQYSGRIQQQVFLRLDLRVLSFSESSVTLGGAANIRVETRAATLQ